MQKLLNIKREYLLIGASLLVLLLCYKLAFKPTIEAWQLHHRLSKQLVQASDLSYQPGYLERKNRNLNRLLDLFKADTISFRSNMLSRITIVAQGQDVKLIEVPTPDVSYHAAGFILEKLSFQGDYFTLVKTLNKLQQTSGIGQIRSVNIRSVKSHSSNNETSQTIMEVYLVMSAQ